MADSIEAEVVLVQEVPHVRVRAVGVYTVGQVRDLIRTLQAVVDRAERVGAALADPAPAKAEPAPDADLDVYRSGTGRAYAGRPDEFRGTTLTKVGTVSRADWGRPEVKDAYYEYGRHIGKRFDLRDGYTSGTITGFAFDPARGGCYVVTQSPEWGRGWMELFAFKKYGVV